MLFKYPAGSTRGSEVFGIGTPARLTLSTLEFGDENREELMGVVGVIGEGMSLRF